MACVKIPLILLAMTGLQVTVTPPQPPPAHDEEAPSTSLEVVVKQRIGPWVVKTICWIAALAETLVLVAHTSPDNPFSRFVLSCLVVSGSADHVRVSPLFIIGVALAVIGGYIRFRCYRELGSLFTFEMSIRADHKLVRSGPYAIVRHPGYLGVLCAVIGIICWHTSSGSYARACGAFEAKIWQGLTLVYVALVSTIIAGLLGRMSKEDEALQKEFRGDWEEWVEQVPHKLLPGIY